jgi:uncharacterized protein YndB with AHSA1/START domain
MTETARDVVISRWFEAPVTAVWAAFTDADQLARWYGPAGVSVDRESVRVEARPGGTWAMTMLAGERRMPLHGTVTEVEAPHHLVVTDEMPDGTVVTMTVELTEVDGGTRLDMRQGPFPTTGADGAEAAWLQAMDKLTVVLG